MKLFVMPKAYTRIFVCVLEGNGIYFYYIFVQIAILFNVIWGRPTLTQAK